MTQVEILDNVLFALADQELSRESENSKGMILTIEQFTGIPLKVVFEALKLSENNADINLYQTKLLDDKYIEFINTNINIIRITKKGILFILEKGGYSKQRDLENESLRRRKLEDKILKINVKTYIWSVVSIVITVLLSLTTLFLSFFNN